MVSVRLPDGSVRQYDHPVTVAEVAASIGAGLAKAALAGKLNGELVDTSFLIDRDSSLAIVTDKGFYDDFSNNRPFTPEDLEKIEKRMQELAKKDEAVSRRVVSRDEAVGYFKSIGEKYKAE